MIILKFKLLKTKDESRAMVLRNKFAEFLSEHGFKPCHWYANWKEIQENVWLVFTGDERDVPSLEMRAEILLRDSPPNVGGRDFVPKDEQEFKKIVEEKVKPMVISLLDKSPIKYEVIA